MKFVSTTDDTIGGRLLDNNMVVTAKVIDGRKVVEILEATKEQLEEVLPLAQNIIQQLREFFNSIFNRFPCVIVEGGKKYVYTLQPAPFKGIDRAFYMSVEDGEIIYMTEDKRMIRAKNELYGALKSKGYVH